MLDMIGAGYLRVLISWIINYLVSTHRPRGQGSLIAPTNCPENCGDCPRLSISPSQKNVLDWQEIRTIFL